MKSWTKVRVNVFGFMLAMITIAMAISQIGCGGSGALSLSPLPTFTPGSVSDTDRDAAYTSVETLFDSVSGQPDAAAQLVAKMKSMKQFATAEISESGDAIGWFTDGQMYACILTDPPIRPQPSFKASKYTTQTQVKPKDLPGAPTAYLVDAFEAARPDITPVVTPELTNKGYNVVALGGKVSDWATISNAGILFVHAHGLISTDKHRVPRFWYSTSEKPSAALNATYKAYRDKGTIAVGVGWAWQGNNTAVKVRTYMVNDQFLHDSGMSFAKNAVWISQSCTSYNQYMLNAVIDPTTGFSNVAEYAGWTKEEDSWDSTATSAFVFDRLLGVNQAEPVDPNNPPPYTINDLRNLLSDTIRPGGSLPYDESAPDNVTALFKMVSRVGSNVPTIIPVITDAVADSSAQTLTISGSFGIPEGSITISGTPLAIHSWSETSVVVDLPSQTTGTLVARSIGDSSSAGYLLSNAFDYKALVVEIVPVGGTLQHKEQKTFTVGATTGTIPSGAKYRWTLTGKGSLAGGSPQTTTSSSVSYTSPNVDTADSLKVEVLNPSGTVAATAIDTIAIGNAAILYTVTGDVTNEQIPPLADGTFNRPFSRAFHYALTGKDGASVQFIDPVTTDAILLGFTLSSGGKFTVGQSFTSGTNKAGGFAFLPGTGHSFYGFNATSGTLTITSVTDNGNGTFNIGFNGSETDVFGCKISASGTFVFNYNYDAGP